MMEHLKNYGIRGSNTKRMAMQTHWLMESSTAKESSEQEHGRNHHRPPGSQQSYSSLCWAPVDRKDNSILPCLCRIPHRINVDSSNPCRKPLHMARLKCKGSRKILPQIWWNAIRPHERFETRIAFHKRKSSNGKWQASKGSNDQTGQPPFTSSKGNRYAIVAIHVGAS